MSLFNQYEPQTHSVCKTCENIIIHGVEAKFIHCNQDKYSWHQKIKEIDDALYKWQFHYTPQKIDELKKKRAKILSSKKSSCIIS